MRKLSRIDREALTRALELERARSPADRQRVDDLLKERSWFSVADAAVYSFQRELIRPRLWQPIPAYIEPADVDAIIARGPDGLSGEYQAARLLRKMLKAGLSRYEPEPLKALAEAAAARQRATLSASGSKLEPEPDLV
jgi:hypothetical protein